MRSAFYAILTLALLLPCSAKAQQDAQFSQFMFNKIYYNPADAGFNEEAFLSLTHRSQWLGYEGSFESGGAPTTQLLTYSSPFPFVNNSGLALYLVNDQLGALSNREAQLSLSYFFPVGSGRLSLGLKGGIYMQTMDFDLYRSVEPDPLVRQGKDSQFVPDVSAGIMYKNDNLYFGVSMNHLLQSELSFGIEGLQNQLNRNAYALFGFDYQIDNSRWKISPNTILKTDLNSLSFEVNVMGVYNDKYWGGLSYRQSDAGTIIIGANLSSDNKLRASYSFDYVFSGQEVKSPTSHEIMIFYILPKPQINEKIKIRTPRYIH